MRWLILLFASSLWAANYPSQQSMLLDVGATSVTLHDLGAAATDYTFPVPLPGGGQRIRLTVSPIKVSPPSGSTYTSCSNPCTKNIWRDWGDHYAWEEIVDGSGNPLSPPKLSSALRIPFAGVSSAAGTWTLPLNVIGQDNFVRSVQFTLGAGTYTSIRGYARINNHGYQGRGTGHPGSTANKSDGKMSAQVNGGAWVDLNCSSITQIDENRWYGMDGVCGISSAPNTIEITWAIADNLLVAGTNTVNFRFNGTDGNTSGYRVLNFNFSYGATLKTLSSISVTANVATGTATSHGLATNDWVFVYGAPGIRARFNGARQVTGAATNTFTFAPCGAVHQFILSGVCTSPNGTFQPRVSRWAGNGAIPMAAQPVMNVVKLVIPGSTFTLDDPTTWTAPVSGDATRGQNIWNTGDPLGVGVTLMNPNAPYINNTLSVKCKDCHTVSGRDLKYFAYDNYTIQQRSIFHGLTNQNALDVAAFIRGVSVTVPAMGRPWNPPYFPGTGLDANALNDWSAGAGLDAQLTYGDDAIEYMAPGGSWTAGVYSGGSFTSWAGTNAINMHELPLPWQFQDWNHWLARVHPQDYFITNLPTDFFHTPWYLAYLNFRANVTPGNFTSFNTWLQGSSAIDFQVNGLIPFRNALLTPSPAADTMGFAYPSTLYNGDYAINQISVVKSWELMQEYGVEGMLGQQFTSVYGARPSGNYIARGWYAGGHLVFNQGDHKAVPSDIHSGGDDTAISHIYLSNSWYLTQTILNGGNFRGAGDNQVDWAYEAAYLQNAAGQSSPGGALASGRPSGYLSLLSTIIGPQMQTDSGVVGTNPCCLSYNNLRAQSWLGFNLRYNFAFLADAQITELFTQLANNLVSFIGRTNTTGWQSYFTGDVCVGANPAGNAYSQNGTNCDNAAFMLPLLVYYGVPSGTINTIQTWAEAVWSPRSFAADRAATCSLNVSGDGSSWPKCTNVP